MPAAIRAAASACHNHSRPSSGRAASPHHQDPTVRHGPRSSKWGRVAVDRSTGLPIADYSWLPKAYHATYQAILEMDEGIALLHHIVAIEILPTPTAAALPGVATSYGPIPPHAERLGRARVLLLSCDAIYLCSDSGDILRAMSVEAIECVLLCDEWLCLSVAPRNEPAWDVAFRFADAGHHFDDDGGAAPLPRPSRTLPTTQFEFLAILNQTRALSDAPRLLPVVVASHYAIASRLLHAAQHDASGAEEAPPPPIPFLTYEALRNAEHPNTLIDVLSFEHRLRCPRLETWELEKRSLDGLLEGRHVRSSPRGDADEAQGMQQPHDRPPPSPHWRPQVQAPVQSPRRAARGTQQRQKPPRTSAPAPCLTTANAVGSNEGPTPNRSAPLAKERTQGDGNGSPSSRRPPHRAAPNASATSLQPPTDAAQRQDNRRRLQALLDDDGGMEPSAAMPASTTAANTRVPLAASTNTTPSEVPPPILTSSSSLPSVSPPPQATAPHPAIHPAAPTHCTTTMHAAAQPTHQGSTPTHRPPAVTAPRRSPSNDSNTILVEVAVSDGDADSPRAHPPAPGAVVGQHPNGAEEVGARPCGRRWTANRFMSPTSSAIARRESAAAERRTAVELRAEQRAQDIRHPLTDRKQSSRRVPAARPRAAASKSPVGSRGVAGAKQPASAPSNHLPKNGGVAASAMDARRTATPNAPLHRQQRTPSPRSTLRTSPRSPAGPDGSGASPGQGGVSPVGGRQGLMQLWEALKAQRQSLDLLTHHVEAMVLQSPTPADPPGVQGELVRPTSERPAPTPHDVNAGGGVARSRSAPRGDFASMTEFQRSLLTRPLPEIHPADAIAVAGAPTDCAERSRKRPTERRASPPSAAHQVAAFVQASTTNGGMNAHHLKTTRATRRQFTPSNQWRK